MIVIAVVGHNYPLMDGKTDAFQELAISSRFCREMTRNAKLKWHAVCDRNDEAA